MLSGSFASVLLWIAIRGLLLPGAAPCGTEELPRSFHDSEVVH